MDAESLCVGFGSKSKMYPSPEREALERASAAKLDEAYLAFKATGTAESRARFVSALRAFTSLIYGEQPEEPPCG